MQRIQELQSEVDGHEEREFQDVCQTMCTVNYLCSCFDFQGLISSFSWLHSSTKNAQQRHNIIMASLTRLVCCDGPQLKLQQKQASGALAWTLFLRVPSRALLCKIRSSFLCLATRVMTF